MSTTKLKDVPLSYKPKLIISKELQSQIMFLHNKVENDEWCGTLFYSIVSGDISDPDNLILKAEKMFLGGIGSGTYTDQSVDETIVDFYNTYPEAMTTPWKQGFLHTHHSMATFFSTTDMAELYDNAGSHNYYLSLIVNHNSKFCAKIAIVGVREVPATSYKFRGNNAQSEYRNAPQTENVLMLLDCIIEFEQSEFEVERYKAIKAKKTVVYHPSTTPLANNHSSTQFRNQATAWNEGLFADNGEDIYAKDYDYTTPESRSKQKSEAKDIDEISLRSFVSKWLALDILDESLLSDNLKKLAQMKDKQIDKYIDDLDNNLDGFAKDILGVETQSEFEVIINKSISLLRGYGAYRNLPMVISMLKDNIIYSQTLK